MCSGSGENGPKPQNQIIRTRHWLAYEFDYTINQIISPIPKAIYCIFHYKMKDKIMSIMSAFQETNIRMTFYD